MHLAESRAIPFIKDNDDFPLLQSEEELEFSCECWPPEKGDWMELLRKFSSL